MRDVREVIKRTLTRAVERDSWDRNGKLYVSDLKHAIPLADGGDCRLKLWAKLRDEPQEPLTSGVELMFGIGDLVHDHLVTLLRDHLPGDWEILGVEERVQVNGARGRYDLKLGLPNGETMIVDFKTKRGGAFSYLDYEGPKSPDVRQVQAYCMADDADRGMLVYVDREGQNFIRVYEVERDDELVKEDLATLIWVRGLAQKGSPLPLEEFLTPTLSRADNKGKDSLKLTWPWQVDWCHLEDCLCRDRYDDMGQDEVTKAADYGKIVGWCREQDDGSFVLDMKDRWNDTDLRYWIMQRLNAGEYSRH